MVLVCLKLFQNLFPFIADKEVRRKVANITAEFGSSCRDRVKARSIECRLHAEQEQREVTARLGDTHKPLLCRARRRNEVLLRLIIRA